MVNGTIFLDFKSDDINNTRYTFTTSARKKSFIRVNKGKSIDNGYEMYIHEHIESVPDFKSFKLIIKPKPIKPGGFVRLDIHRLTMLVWSDDFLKQIKHYEVYFNKDSLNVPIIFGFVTSEDKKNYYSCKDIFEYTSEIYTLEKSKIFNEVQLQSKLKSENERVGDFTFKINETNPYGNVQVNSSTVFDYYKKYTHTTNVYFKNSKIELGDKWTLESFNPYSYPSFLLVAIHVYFNESNQNINPLLYQFEKQTGSTVTNDYYELYDVDKTDPDSNNWVKKYRKRGKSDIQNTEELLKEIYTTIFGSNKAGAIAGGVTTTVILGGGGVAGGVLYYKYPGLVLSLISKIAGK